MSLPETIPVRFTEEEAGYLSVRPVVRQTFRLAELTDMIVSVTGKDALRVEQIFRAGAVLYNGYRYWWDGISAAPGEVAALLASFPDPDPSRLFPWEEVAAVLLESGGGPARTAIEVTRADASRRRLFRRRSAWDCLHDALRDSPPVYEEYSYARRTDLYRKSLDHDAARRLRAELLATAPRALRARLVAAAVPSALVFACPRATARP